MPANSRRSVRPHASEESSCLGPGFHSGHSAATHLGEAGVPLPRCATSAPASNPSPRSPNSSNLPVAAADTAPAHGPFWGLPVPPSTRAPRCATSSPAVKRPSQKSPSCSTSPRPRRRLWRAGSATQALGLQDRHSLGAAPAALATHLRRVADRAGWMAGNVMLPVLVPAGDLRSADGSGERFDQHWRLRVRVEGNSRETHATPPNRSSCPSTCGSGLRKASPRTFTSAPAFAPSWLRQ